ncbi:hypothetical protein AVEN_145282-1 [Araneus ventricosus]|uniref:Secreted protein n=1 Tax=Araneus ventricosus TaxID=182803 RepID=A0A4Y2H0L4_ARAVE|nr:hypothetical protein AVEN_145282-1 [Araneus ventricosus]
MNYGRIGGGWLLFLSQCALLLNCVFIEFPIPGGKSLEVPISRLEVLTSCFVPALTEKDEVIYKCLQVHPLGPVLPEHFVGHQVPESWSCAGALGASLFLIHVVGPCEVFIPTFLLERISIRFEGIAMVLQVVEAVFNRSVLQVVKCPFDVQGDHQGMWVAIFR